MTVKNQKSHANAVDDATTAKFLYKRRGIDMADPEVTSLPGVEITDHRYITTGESGELVWGRVVVDAVRGFRTSEELDKFIELGGRIATPVAIEYGGQVADSTDRLMVIGVGLPNPAESNQQRTMRLMGFERG
jgi:hypothetical protein